MRVLYTVLVAGIDCANAANDAASTEGVEKVLHAENSQYKNMLSEPISELLIDLMSEYDYLVSAATTNGKNILPRVAAKLDVSQISEIIGVINGKTFQRPIYAGNAIATVESSTDKNVITIRTTAFETAKESKSTAEISSIGIEKNPGLSEFVEEKVSGGERPELTSAGAIVSGGRGMQSGDNFKLLESVADKLGAAVGASRAAVDAGFVPNEYQVGQTGKVVAPELYIAVGISGAIQHLAGMKDSKVIVAINKDDEAPIFEVADYGLVADLFDAVPDLDKELEKNTKIKKMVTQVGIAGCGLMGSAIADTNLQAGFDVVIFDINERQLSNAKEKLDKKINESNQLATVKYTNKISSLENCDLIIECLTEDENIKSNFFKKIEENCDRKTIIATNTSSISINRLASSLQYPERFLGLHFMNPPQIIKLVEIINHNALDKRVLKKITQYLDVMDMISIECNDKPGFIVNRILLPMINEAIYCYENGTSDAKSIDTALKVGANHPMGPLELADFIGLDTCLSILRILQKDFNDAKYKPCPLLEEYVQCGKLGRKTRKDFYKY